MCNIGMGTLGGPEAVDDSATVVHNSSRSKSYIKLLYLLALTREASKMEQNNVNKVIRAKKNTIL